MTATLLAGLFTLLMPGGLTLIATGLGRAKNAAHTMIGHLICAVVALLSFFAVGYALTGTPSTTGGDTLLFAHHHGFCLIGLDHDPRALCWFLIAATGAMIAAIIPLGAMIERLSLKAHLAIAVVVGGLLYPLAACWLWTWGWLYYVGSHVHALAGPVDYAGAGAVHLLGGAVGLCAAILIRPRLGKFDVQGTPRPILGHHVPMVMFGSWIVFVAWLGFTTARSFLLDDGQAALVVVTTMLGGAGGAAGAAAYMWMRFGRPDPSLTCNGLLAGLVAISAGCATISPAAALLIGVIAGCFAIIAVLRIERLGIDDPVGVSSVHGLAGAWGMLAVGLFANGTSAATGLFYGGGVRLLLGQAIAVGAIVALALLGTIVTFWCLSRFGSEPRVTAEIEYAGLDIPETGAPGYPEFIASLGPESFGGGVMR